MRVCYTGGGTLGHVWPALSVHQILKQEAGYECLFIGSTKKGEKETVEKECVPFVSILSGKLRRYFSLKTIFSALACALGLVQSFFILLRYKPDVLFSKGGYVSVPVVLAAHLLHIPVVTHESDTTPGLATRINARYAQRVCVACEEAKGLVKGREVVVTGNPLRRELLCPPRYSVKERLSTKLPLILVLGGSQGAMQINDLVWNNLDALCAKAYVYHQCGEKNLKAVRHENYHLVGTITDGLDELYTEADLVISRSGAGAVSEICHFGKASLLIPLSRTTSRGDQEENAARLEKNGAAVVLKDDSRFMEIVSSLLEDSTKRSKLGEQALSLDIPDAAERIARVVSLAAGKKE